jgi:hypothetical protein
MSIPSKRSWVEKEIDKYYDLIKLPEHYHQIGNGDSIFAKCVKLKWMHTNKNVYLHIYFSHDKVKDDYQTFLNNITKLKEQYETQIKPDTYLVNNYSKYLIINNTKSKGLSIKYNNKEISTYQNKYSGFFCLLSPSIHNPFDAIQIYRNRDKVEKSFDDLKNSLDGKRFRVDSSSKMQCKAFVHFLSLIYKAKFRSMLQPCTTSVKYLSESEIIDDLKGLSKIKISEDSGQIFTSADKRTKQILEFFKIKWPTKSN